MASQNRFVDIFFIVTCGKLHLASTSRQTAMSAQGGELTIHVSLEDVSMGLKEAEPLKHICMLLPVTTASSHRQLTQSAMQML